MTLPFEEAKAFIGVASDWEFACDEVERGAIRRFAQAIMNEDASFWHDTLENKRFGGPVAPPLFPTTMFRRPFGAPDPIQERAEDPDFDGTGMVSSQGLPEITPLSGFAVLNGGSEIELFRSALVGDRVKVRSRYVDISEKLTSKGPLIFVIIESEYRTAEDGLLLKVRRTQIRRSGVAQS